MSDVQLGSPALVIGFAIHGLAVARALARSGVAVHVLAETATRRPPSAYTRYGRVHFRPGLNTAQLPQVLMDFADELRCKKKIVLFPTSDRIAKSIALAWPQLSDRFLLSWAHCRDLVLELQRKDSLLNYCERAGVRFPRSRNLAGPSDCDRIAGELRFPLVVKPAQPLSAFKAIRVTDPEALREVVANFASELPFVVQEWIEGPEPSLYAVTAYLNRGTPVGMFTSRKLAASPPGLGQGTVFETRKCPEISDIACRFLAGLDLSGPVAVEFKRDGDGTFWLIEPNVGRTEYCVDLAVHSGFNLPYVEYLHATGRFDEVPPVFEERDCVWFDTDKDITCFIGNASHLWSNEGFRRPVFPYVGHADWLPLTMSCVQLVGRASKAMARRMLGIARRA